MADNQITPFQLTDQFTMDNFNQRINETNTALQNNDPRQWGIGTNFNPSPDPYDADTITLGGIYAVSQNSPTGDWATVLHIPYEDNRATQIGIPAPGSYKGCWCKREKYEGAWKPWEWVNPPMLIGEEYRTTERYRGKPVYTMLVDFGSFPNSTQKDVAIPEKGFFAHNVCIDFTKSVVTYPNDHRTSILPFKNGITEISVNNACVRVTTSSDLSSASGYICVKYTKSTD